MTIFSATINGVPSYQLVLDGLKTETRRLVKPGQIINRWYEQVPRDERIDEILQERAGQQPCGVWCVGKTYAIQPARTARSIGRFEVVDIWREDVRKISLESAIAEGATDRLNFLEVWTWLADRGAQFYQDGEGFYRCYINRKLKWQSLTQAEMWEHLWTRPAKRYDAWAIKFEVVSVVEPLLGSGG